jgi:superfamily II DNA/RNA helicase
MYKKKIKNHRPPSRRRHGQSKKKGSGIDIHQFIQKGRETPKEKPYEPVHRFKDFALHTELLNRIDEKGYSTPTEIQDKSIPLSLEGQNVVGVAGTGTGKTASFLIPIIDQVMERKQDQHALIIAPTRELALQINDEFRSLTKGLKIFSTCLIGGGSVGESIRNLKKRNHLIIGTPGRIMDMHRQGHLLFDRFHTLVLDEFDRMLDMGFKEEMRSVNQKMRAKKQTLLFSATLEASQKDIIAEMIGGRAVEVKVKTCTQKTDAIDQDVIRVQGQDKFQLMHQLLVDSPEHKVILFCETKRGTEKMAKKLKERDILVDAIHGDKSQRAREVALRKFKSGRIQVLVATDVAARGIDVPNVSLVINYEAPRTYNDYVHRIGRTGRAGKMGKAITMID